MLKWLGNLVDSNDKQIKRLQPLVDEINELEAEFQKLTDAELLAKTAEFKKRMAEATPEIIEEMTQAATRLEETKRCLPDILDEFEKKDKENECKQDRKSTRLNSSHT